MQGKIVKGIAGFYYVYTEESGIVECRAKGLFRKENKKPLVGDNVEVEILPGKEKTGNIVKICARKNELIRPAVANIDQALVVFSVTHPEPNFNLLDRFLLMMRQNDLPVTVCFSKQDLIGSAEEKKLYDVYRNAGCGVIFLSVREKIGTDQLKSLLDGRTTAVAGPSGVGKSTLINYVCPQARMEIGEISEKIERGKNTTRHTELFHIAKSTYIMDTPGFSSLGLFDMEKEKLKDFYPEFWPFEGMCRFRGCMHMEEPGCRVKEAVEQGKISCKRYENYKMFYEELKSRKKY